MKTPIGATMVVLVYGYVRYGIICFIHGYFLKLSGTIGLKIIVLCSLWPE